MLRRAFRNVWLQVGGFLVLVVVFVALLTRLQGETNVVPATTAVGTLLTAAGVFVAFIALRENHRWNRRQLTIQLMMNWNQFTRRHLDAVSEEFPEFLQVPNWNNPHKNWDEIQKWKIDSDRASRIASSSPEPASPAGKKRGGGIIGSGKLKNEEVRSHLVSLFNYFESLAVAYSRYAVERDIVEKSYQPIMIDLYHFFEPFIVSVAKKSESAPWPPLDDIVGRWRHERMREAISKTADDLLDRLGKRPAEENPAQPTGIP